MTRRSLSFVAASLGFAAVLIVYLWSSAGLQSGAVLRLLAGIGPESAAEVTLLLALNSFLAGERWRLVERHLAGCDVGLMPRPAYFAWTALGTGFGQLVPTQLSLALCRSIGLRLHHGRGLVRGTLVTLFEQFFDVAVAAIVGAPSVWVMATGGGVLAWTGAVLIAVAAGTALYLCTCTILQRFFHSPWRQGQTGLPGGTTRLLAEAAQSGLLGPAVTLRMFGLSAVRFVGFVLMAAVSAHAASLNSPVWQLAAAQPFAVLGNVLAITPGGLGVNEWATTSALFMLGASFQAAAQWAVLNRALVAFAALSGAAIGILTLVTLRQTAPQPAR